MFFRIILLKGLSKYKYKITEITFKAMKINP